MANEKRLIDANALQLEPDPWGGMNGVICVGRSGGKTMATVQAALRRMIDNAPTVDAVILPKGKPGDYVLWTNGVCERLFEIYSIMICKDGIRYDLGDLSPFVNHSHILKIMNREEAERWMENGK